jgi:hypothetical protein
MLQRIFTAIVVLAVFSCGLIYAQGTSSIQGTILDATGAPVPNATVVARNMATGEERSTVTGPDGVYALPAMPVGTYRVTVSARGMQTMVANDLVLQVGSAHGQNFTMQVAAAQTEIQVTAAAPVISSETISVGTVVNQQTVQEIPLNGRHFVDLTMLTAGTVTPPQNGFLTTPLRGQGFFGFNTAGAREDQVNYMLNGINLSDPVQNQITFQPTINTVQEFKVDNSTYSAEYGRNSGAITNIVSRSGTNQFHGEAYEYLRNYFFDARNFANPVGVRQSPFIRNQFGGDGGGPIIKNKAFFFLSYEQLLQRQSVPLSTQVLSPAQRAQAAASSDAVIQKLLPLIPVANSPGNFFISSAVAPVNIYQGTANISYDFSDKNRFNVYYAGQHDLRDEPPSTQGNNLPGYGDTRQGLRQLLTINDTDSITPDVVNEARIGFNRIHITFSALNTLNAADYGINSGVNAAIGLPQITVTGAFAFGGINGFPQGRGDDTGEAGDTLHWVRGKHTLSIGAMYRRIVNDNFTYTPGSFTFPSISAFLADQANAFTANPSNRASRIYVNSIGAFVQDAYHVTTHLMFELGLRYDWYGTPSEARNRFVEFVPSTDSLVQIGAPGSPYSIPYNQSNLNFQPRLGLAWDVFGNNKTVVRTAYAIMTDQPITGLVTGLASNPPFAFPVSFVPTTATPFVSLTNAYGLASGAVSPASVAHSYKDSYVQGYNFNIQQQLGHSVGIMAGYFGSKGTDLNIGRNYNQFINGVRPYPTLSPTSPIDPGMRLSNITVYESDGNSNYNALWITANKSLSHGITFNTYYSLSKSIDYNSRNVEGVVVQNSNCIRCDRGLSDFDTRNRFVFSGIWTPHQNGGRLTGGWQFAVIAQVQSGNPTNVFTTNTTLTGNETIRPSVTGPIQTGYAPSPNGNPSNVEYLLNPGVFYNQGNAFGNLGRNVMIGPGFVNVDVSFAKTTKITERLSWQFRADAFDILNHPNLVNYTPAGLPGMVYGSPTFGILNGTRFPPGDEGSSRQLQLSSRLIF